jgi:hypothetical protein
MFPDMEVTFIKLGNMLKNFYVELRHFDMYVYKLFYSKLHNEIL